MKEAGREAGNAECRTDVRLASGTLEAGIKDEAGDRHHAGYHELT